MKQERLKTLRKLHKILEKLFKEAKMSVIIREDVVPGKLFLVPKRNKRSLKS